jgi:hypothetical protein
MKKIVLLLTTVFSLALHSPAASAQTPTHSARVIIRFGAPPAGDAPYQLPYLGDDVFAVRVSKASMPTVEGAIPVSRRAEADALVFSFSIRPGSDASVNRLGDGLEVTLVPAAGPAGGVAGTPSAPPSSTSVTPSAATPAGGSTTTPGGVPLVVASTPSALTSPAGTAASGGASSTVVATTPAGAPHSPGGAGAAAAAGAVLAAFPLALLPDQSIKRANIDLSVPESPAFTVLSLTPQTVVRPASPREFVTSILNGLDKDGNFQTGIAIDTAPFLLLAGNNLNINDYRKPGNHITRLLARTQMSFATTKGASDDDPAVRMSLGFQATLLDKGDPRLDRELDNCFAANILPTFMAFAPINPLSPAAAREAEIARRTAILQGLAEPCREESRKRNWNRTSWIVAAAPSWISPTGSSNAFRWNGGGAWTSFAYGFEGVDVLRDTSQLILHARYRNKESVADPDNEGQFLEQNSATFGARLRIGKPDFTGNFEGVYNHNKPDGRPGDNSYSFSFAAERKLSDGLFFVLSLGREGGHQNGEQNGAVIRSSFRWGFSRKSIF